MLSVIWWFLMFNGLYVTCGDTSNHESLWDSMQMEFCKHVASA
jgi:hypothetical protein